MSYHNLHALMSQLWYFHYKDGYLCVDRSKLSKQLLEDLGAPWPFPAWGLVQIYDCSCQLKKASAEISLDSVVLSSSRMASISYAIDSLTRELASK